MPLTRVSYPYADALTISNASIGSLFTTSQTFASTLTVQPKSVAVPLIVRSATSGSANIQEWQNGLGNILASINALGSISAVDLTLSGNLTVNGTTTNINTVNLVVEDKNIVLGDVSVPSTTTADGGGLTLLAGGTNKTLNWINATDRWTSNVGLEATSFVRTSGTASQFLKADGTVDSSTYLTGNQSISLSGDITGTGTTAITTTLANSGVVAGTYQAVTVNAKGLVTGGTNPTTLSGFGITDALSNSTTSTQSGFFGDIFLFDDSTPSHYLQVTNSANLTAARILNINTNDADRTISLSGNLTVSSAATISGTNTGDQTITLTGDVTGTGTGSFATTLANSGVTAGTYRSVTVDVKGRVTGGTNPTTLSGYGITDALDTSATAQTKSGNLTAAQFIRSGGTSSQFLKADGSVDSSTYLTTGTASSTYAALSGATFTGAINGTSLTLSGDLTVNGTTTNINTTNLLVEDKNIVLGDVATPSTATADGGGLTLLAGGSNKTFNWLNATDRWTSSVGLEGTSIVRTGGTASQFLKADGTVDSSSYITAATSFNLGTTSIALNRASASQSLTGISIDGSAGSVAAANITGTTLASGVTASSLTSVGTLTSLTTSGAINLNYASPSITSNNASAASIFTSTVTDITIGSSSIKTTVFPTDGTTSTAAAGAGFMGMPQVVVSSGGRTLAASDAGKHIYMTTTSGQTITIPANSTTAFPIGTTIVIINGNGISTTISITTDTLRLANTTSTGSRTLASNGMCTLVKINTTEWIVGGNGIS